MKSSNVPPVMIGISTEQNTVNIIPAILFECKSMIMGETEGAKKGKWSEGMKEVAKRRKIKWEGEIDLGKGTDIPDMVQSIAYFTQNIPSILWNVGGGQKTHSLALWTVFRDRLFQGKEDFACYSDPTSRKTFLIYDKEIKQEPHDTKVDLGAKEILSIFGMKMDSGILLWDRQQGNRVQQRIPDLLDNKSKREKFIQYGIFSSELFNKYTGRLSQLLKEKFDRKTIEYIRLQLEEKYPINDNNLYVTWDHLAEFINKKLRDYMEKSIFDKMNQERDENFPCPYPPPFDKFSYYFESLIIQRVVDIIKQKKGQKVFQVWKNVEVSKRNSNIRIAEYDVLIVTNFGTLITLDAKTFDFKVKDEHARYYNLQSASGRYAEFWAVFPYFIEDLEPGGILTWKEQTAQRRLPFDLSSRQTRFMVVSDQRDNFWLQKGTGETIIFHETKPAEDDSVECRNLSLLIDNLRL